jgi:hypothetical protein
MCKWLRRCGFCGINGRPNGFPAVEALKKLSNDAGIGELLPPIGKGGGGAETSFEPATRLNRRLVRNNELAELPAITGG